MAKLAQFPMPCCNPCSPPASHCPSHSHRASLANNAPQFPCLGIHIGREARRGAISVVARAGKSAERATFWSAGGCCVSVKGSRDVCYGAISRKRFRIVVGSSSEGAPQLEDGRRYTREAQEAVVKVLQEAGLSWEEASDTVSNAPVFIRELVGCICELEESGLVTAEGGDLSDSTRDSIYQLANQSRGMSPLLESLGVHLPSVSRISSFLSSQPLSELLSKVRYIEELLTKADPRRRPLKGLVQYMVKNLSVSIWDDEDIQQTLTFAEKMRLQESSVGVLETSSMIALLLEGFPRIFKRSLEDGIKPTIRFLEDLGVGEGNLGPLVLCFPPILLQDHEKDLLPRKRILKEVGVRVQDMGRMVVKYPWLLSKCVVNNVEVLVEFLKTIKVPKSRIDRSITRCPHLLGCSCTDALEPRVHHINEFGLKSKRLGRAISQSPELLIHTPEEFDSVVSFVASVGVEVNDISKLMQRSPEILGTSIEGTLQKKLNFLQDLGVHRSKLGRIIKFYPEVLTMSVESALIPRVQCLRKWGFAKHEISRMAFKFPPLLGYNVEAVLRPKLEFLTKSMKRSVKDVVVYPRYFSHSLEKRIKPRARVLENRQIQCDLRTMLAKSDDQFAAEFLGVESIYIPLNR